jgi:TrkA domain protein
MTVYENDLPGVGKKHEIDLGDGARLVVVTHNDGHREVYRRETEDSDSEKLFELSDHLARQVGTILEGAYFQPVESRDVGTLLGDDTRMSWVTVDEGSPLVGRTLAGSDVRAETGVSIVVIERGDDVIPSPGGDTTVRSGDTLVIVGEPADCTAFESRVTGD